MVNIIINNRDDLIKYLKKKGFDFSRYTIRLGRKKDYISVVSKDKTTECIVIDLTGEYRHLNNYVNLVKLVISNKLPYIVKTDRTNNTIEYLI